MEFKLSKPIETHDGKVNSLVLREPTGSDVLKFGFPYEVVPPTKQGEDPKMTVVQDVAMKYVIELSDLDEGLIEQIKPGDLFELMWKVVELTAPSGKP